MYAAKPAAYHGDEAAAGGAIGGANEGPEGTGPCGTRVFAVIVALLALAGAAGRFGTAVRRPRCRRNDADSHGL